MKRFMTIMVVLSALMIASSALAGEAYTWTISNSPSNPLSNSGSFTGAPLYVFLLCCDNSRVQGMSAAEFRIENDNAANGFFGASANGPGGWLLAPAPAQDALVAVGGCPCDWTTAGYAFQFFHGGGATGCWQFAPSTNSGVKVTVDCLANPQVHQIDWIPFSQNGAVCVGKGIGDCVPTDAVEEASWGSIKTLYR